MKTIHDTQWIMKRAWEVYRTSKMSAEVFHKESHKTFSESLSQAWSEYRQQCNQLIEDEKEDDVFELDFAML